MNKYLQIHPSDNVLVALRPLGSGETVNFAGKNFLLKDNIGAKHKFALEDLPAGTEVKMYGILVGKTTRDVPRGGLLSPENTRHATSGAVVREHRSQWSPPDVRAWQNRTFQGYHRADGSVGTANYWIVVPLVFCENRNLEVTKEALLKELGYAQSSRYTGFVQQLKTQFLAGQNVENIPGDLSEETPVSRERLFPNVDGIKFLLHEGGCGCSRNDSDTLCGLLAGYITHPNVAGATVMSLGCQHAQVSILQDEIRRRDPQFDKPLFIFEQQQYGTESKLMEAALRQTFAGLVQANTCVRKPAPLSKLCIGLECGGSDGFSGISANPAIGHTSDLLVALGASVILSEFPELCGVEQELSDRCITRELAAKYLDLMASYNAQAEQVGSGFDMNPSPGNIRDGLITDAIKSAGAAKKGGTSSVAEVLDYPEKVSRPGLALLCTPGNDVESTTAEVAAGANIVLFTTGLGTPTGNPIAPVVKISTDTSLALRMPDIIDIDTGPVIAGTETIEQAGARILDYVIRVAGGEEIPAAVRLGQDDFIPWKRGISL
ncbi:MAG: altronate dehydratase [Lewinellaceae bacterium]|nr:altronate dehydratase [Lewinellaceae bacterium]